MVGLHPRSAACILRFVATLVLANTTGAVSNMAIGAAVHSNAVGNLAASLVVMLLMLFGGFLLNKDMVPWAFQFMSGLSYFNYAYEASIRPCDILDAPGKS